MFLHDDISTKIINWLFTSKNSSIYKKGRGTDDNKSLPVTAAKILYECYKSTAIWPNKLIDAYLDDALGFRVWVDNPSVSAFCGNLTYWTQLCDNMLSKRNPPSSQNKIDLSSDSGSVVGNVVLEDESSGDEEEVILEESSATTALVDSPLSHHEESRALITDRFFGQYLALSDTVSSILLSRSGTSSSQIIITFNTFCTLASVRLLATRCIQTWLGNPALVEHIGRLIMRIVECLLAAGKSYSEFNLHNE